MRIAVGGFMHETNTFVPTARALRQCAFSHPDTPGCTYVEPAGGRPRCLAAIEQDVGRASFAKDHEWRIVLGEPRRQSKRALVMGRASW